MENDKNEKDRIKKPLVSVERQIETDISTGRTETRMFVKMYFEARDSGLLAAISDRLWKTLCCLATYMDEDGSCYPAQKTVARDLGVSRQMANERIQELLRFRFNGKPVISASKARSDHGRWGKNVYRIHPISAFKFGREGEESTVSRNLDTETVSTTVSRNTDKVQLDTNKNQCTNKKHTRVVSEKEGKGAQTLVGLFHRLCGHPESREPLKKELDQASSLIAAHGYEVAEFIVQFGVSGAQATRFDMKHFGALLSYVDDALMERDRQRRHEAHMKRLEREQREEDERLEAEYQAFASLPLEERVDHFLTRWLEAMAAIGKPPTAEQIDEKTAFYLTQEEKRDEVKKKAS